MNVFVLTTGRSGSLTFARACEHATNYTVGHESNDGRLGLSRTKYPVNHIEVDNRLSWLLGRLDREYRHERIFCVHLTREPAQVAWSHYNKFRKEHGGGGDSWIFPHYVKGIVRATGNYEGAAIDLVDTVNTNIELFLRGKPHMSIQIDNAVDQFPELWERIGAEGDLDAALNELSVRHNRSK